MPDFNDHREAAIWLGRQATENTYNQPHARIIDGLNGIAQALLEVADAIRSRPVPPFIPAPADWLNEDDETITPPRHLHPVAESTDDDPPHADE